MPHDRLRFAWIAPPRGAQLPRRNSAPGTTANEKGASDNASPCVVRLTSGAKSAWYRKQSSTAPSKEQPVRSRPPLAKRRPEG